MALGNPRLPATNKVVEILMDYACAAKCPFCYNPPLTAAVLAQRLTLEDIAKSLYLKREQGYDGAWFTGGEVTQRDDLPQALGLARALGYVRIQIGTNGLRTANSQYVRLLTDAGLNCARVSIHGSSTAVHDPILGIPGAFDKAMDSLRMLRKAGVAVGVNFVICRQNLNDISRFVLRMMADFGDVEIDVLFPHQRGMMPLNAARTGISYSEAAKSIVDARRALAWSGFDVPPIKLINFPPCVLPGEFEDWNADWKRDDFLRHTIQHPEGDQSDLTKMKSTQKRQGPDCARCRHQNVCLGFEDDYAREYGTGEFCPVEA